MSKTYKPEDFGLDRPSNVVPLKPKAEIGEAADVVDLDHFTERTRDLINPPFDDDVDSEHRMSAIRALFREGATPEEAMGVLLDPDNKINKRRNAGKSIDEKFARREVEKALASTPKAADDFLEPVDSKWLASEDQSSGTGADNEWEEHSDWDAADMQRMEVPPQQWIVRDLILADDATLNNGDGGAGKTTSMIQLAVSAVVDKPWLGLPIEDGPHNVIFFSCEEDTAKIQLKLKAIVEAEGSPYGITWEDLRGRLRILGLKDCNTTMMANDERGRFRATKMFAFFKQKMDQYNASVAIIDALYDVYQGNESDRAQVRKFVRRVRKELCRTLPTPRAVIVLGHPSLTGITTGTGTSGSTAWKAAFRGFIYTTRVQQKDGSYVHNSQSRKLNYGKPDASVDFVWDDNLGFFVHVEDSTKLRTEADARAEFLRLVAETNAAGEGVTDNPRGNYAPKIFCKIPSVKIEKADFEAAMRALKAEGKIKVEAYTALNRKPGVRFVIVDHPPPRPEVLADFEGYDE